jgi:hypothetical protein
MKNNIKIKYDSESDVLSWELSRKGKIDYASEVGNLIVHFTKNNLPVLVEVLEASKLLRQSKKTFEKSRKLAFAR